VHAWLNDQAAVWLDGRAERQSAGVKAARATNLFRALAPRETTDAQAASWPNRPSPTTPKIYPTS
jgi:hypothetical protein